MYRLNRRHFVSGAAAAAAAAQWAFLGRTTKASANERVALCVVGVRGRGRSLANTFARLPHAHITHVCDVNEPLLGPFGAQVAEWQNSEPRRVTDLRRVLDDKTVDALVVATPDHWHALATIWGCQAGKHVYVEKPISHNVFEGRQMVAAARQYDRCVQVGTQSRSAPHYLEAIELLRNDRIGRVRVAKAWNSQLRRRVNAVPDEPVPSGLDWDIWQGPAPEHPFNSNRYTYGWRWLWDYGTGDMGNDGVHDLDIARWGLGVDYPTEVSCTGDKLVFRGDIQETPDTQYVTFRFPEAGKMLIYEQRLWSPYYQDGFENGVAFYGPKGTLVIGRRGWKIIDPGNEVALDETVPFSDAPHMDNFLTCIRAGGTLNCDIEEGHRSTLLAHLGNLAYRVGRPLTFDGASETIVGDQEANALLKRTGRKPFEIPEQV